MAPHAEGCAARRPGAALPEVLLAAAGWAAFALGIHGGPGVRTASLVALAGTAVLVGRGLAVAGPGADVLGVRRWPGRGALVGCVAGLALGVALATWYRVYLGARAWPSGLQGFAVTALLIGAAEELVYRGYVQGRLKSLGPAGAVLAAAVCHAAYKGALFAGPAATTPWADRCVLMAFTVGVGVLLGALRERSGSLWPCLCAHGLFDVLVYGETALAPWWVWG